MGHRFEEALKETDEWQKEILDFQKASLELSTEIAKRGSEGGNLTEAEKRFMSASMSLHLSMLIRQLAKK